MQHINKYTLIIVLFIFSLNAFAQDFKKDSLQIKVYTEIAYQNNIAKTIKLKKVFCDYCSTVQLNRLGKEALFRAENEKNFPENKLENGKKRLAMYIRISKVDFAAIKEDE